MLRGIHLLRGFIFMRNLEKKKEYGRRYYIKHKKRLRKLAKIYYKLTASVQRANRKKWYKEHRNNPKYREKVKIYGERYRKKYIKQIHKSHISYIFFLPKHRKFPFYTATTFLCFFCEFLLYIFSGIFLHKFLLFLYILDCFYVPYTTFFY